MLSIKKKNRFTKLTTRFKSLIGQLGLSLAIFENLWKGWVIVGGVWKCLGDTRLSLKGFR